MSLDEVLASSLWAWPDPLVKRTQAGQVMFVNAAFLQIYGGQAQEWSGRPVDGWPAPVQMGAQRFESRAGTGEHQQVFDWVESTMGDGNALAIARNVTVFTAQVAPAPVIPAPIAPAQVAAPAPTPPAPQPAAPAQAEAPDLSSEFAQTMNKQADEFAYEDNQAAPTPPQKAQEAPIADQMAVQSPPPQNTPGPQSEPVHVPAQATAPETTQEPAQQPVPESVQEQVQEQQAAPQPVQQQAPVPSPSPRPEPAMERRALPIKDSENVLGSNWRDQVIAKAVGGPDAEEVAAAMGRPPPEEVAPEEHAKPGEGLQILLAEDNAINALLTRTLLEAEGAEVDTVEDGALALEAVGKKKYDLVFMDMRMPNMDGLESTRKIRAYGFDRPIIALTANAFDDDRNACFDSGMNDFMTKPVSAEELSEMVANWAGGEDKQKLAS